MADIGLWLGRLAGEVKSVSELGHLLREIGCFDPPTASLKVTPSLHHARSPRSHPNILIAAPESAVVPAAKCDVSHGPGGSGGDDDRFCGYNVRAMETQIQEAVAGLRFNLSALQRAVNEAHINMRRASQEFALLLRRVRFVSKSIGARRLVIRPIGSLLLL